MTNQNYKPVGLAIRELRENLIKTVKESGLDPAVVVLVMKDMVQQLAELEAQQIQQYIQEKGEGEDGPERG